VTLKAHKFFLMMMSMVLRLNVIVIFGLATLINVWSMRTMCAEMRGHEA
jgi:hypothetical protein